MGMLNYAATISLDGYIADSTGNFQWAAPTEDVFAMHLARLSGVTTEILGRRTYHLMQYWEDPAQRGEMTEPEQEFARYWQDVNKIIVSSTLATSQLRSDRDRLQRDLCLADIRRIVAATEGVVAIFGPTTAAEAIRACLVDQFEFFVIPLLLGGGRKALPDGAYRKLRLEDTKTFSDGTVYLRYGR